jgi:pseudouridine kinase
VARNIAHNLKLLGHEVQLATVFGDDRLGQSMMEECEQLGINLSLSTQYEDAKSPLFLSINDEIGNMQSAMSDIELNSYLNLDWLMARIDAINRSDMVVADTLLSTDALAFLLDHCLVPLYIDAVSPNRAMMLSEAMRKSWKKSFYALKSNLAEAQALTGLALPEEATKALVSKGIKEVYLTMGEDGVAFRSQKEYRHFPAIEAEAVNVTGSGDAFFAGIIHAHAIGISGMASVGYGLKAACHNVKSEAPVNPTLRLSVFE